MRVAQWLVTAGAVLVMAGPAAAGEVQIGARWGQTRLEVDGDRLSSGNSVNDKLLSGGFTLGYRWENGFVVEIGGSGSSDFMNFLGFNELDHTSLGAGWQFDFGRWRVTPKAGLVATELRSMEENIFEGGEPVDSLDDTVPFAEVTLDRRFGRYFVLGVYLRQNFEKFGGSQMAGLHLGLNF